MTASLREAARDVEQTQTWVRDQFPSLQRYECGEPVCYLDGPAGTQVPMRVADAVRDHLLKHNANHAGRFATSQENDAMLERAYAASAALFGSTDSAEVAFGSNMTTLTMHLSRSLGRTWESGDEIIVTTLDHDANVRPWVLAARDAGATVRQIPIREEDCTLDMDAFTDAIGSRTRFIAVGAASNSVGSKNPIQAVVGLAKQVGALVFVDAVHAGPHAAMDVHAWGCDFAACSAYKFFGPHVGILWGRRELLEDLEPYKLEPAPAKLPGRWQTGTQNFACIAGTLESIEYIADLGRRLRGDSGLSLREALMHAYGWIERYEEQLVWDLLDGLSNIPAIKVYGITDRSRSRERMPTLSLTSARYTARELAEQLGKRGIYTWHGNYYAWELSHALGKEPEGMLRIGLVHYNTGQEVERTVDVLSQLHS